jgi:hypothetical protein
MVHDDGSDAMLGEKESCPPGFERVDIAMTDVCYVMPPSQA